MAPDHGPDKPPICDYEGSDYQNRFWDQGERDYEDQVEAVALARLLPTQGRLMLEVGAGAGRNTRRYKGFEQVVLLDYSRTQLQQARDRLGTTGRYIFVAADVYRLPFVEGLFDAATMIRVLHHMADAPLALRNQRQALKSGGIFILEYANKQNLKAILRYATRRQDWSPFDPQPVEFAALNFDFHPGTVRNWLRAEAFEVQKQLTVSHFRIGVLKRNLPTSWLVKLDSAAQWTGDLWQLSPSVFVRAVAVGEAPPDQKRTGSFFRCPECQAPLAPELVGKPQEGVLPEEGSFSCPGCRQKWAFEDGIFIFK